MRTEIVIMIGKMSKTEKMLFLLLFSNIFSNIFAIPQAKIIAYMISSISINLFLGLVFVITPPLLTQPLYSLFLPLFVRLLELFLFADQIIIGNKP